MSTTFLAGYRREDNLTVRHFLKDSKLRSREDITKAWPALTLTPWMYRQIHHFLRNSPHLKDYSRPLTAFEKLCFTDLPQRHVISKLYSLLESSNTSHSLKACAAWQHDLEISISPEAWNHIYDHMHKGSICVSTQESNYKVFSR
ncbi:unnamed protein product, partial [Staurois parvus]